jgi:hypothetical protein
MRSGTGRSTAPGEPAAGRDTLNEVARSWTLLTEASWTFHEMLRQREGHEASTRGSA